MSSRRYTDEQIAEAVKSSKSISETARRLGIGKSGSSWNHLATRIQRAGLDTTHFLGQRANCGKNHKGGPKRRTPRQLLKRFATRSEVPQGALLRRALVEEGVPFECGVCGLGPEWEGRPLVLQVDHISGDRCDCRKSNLRFLCPNCHSQTSTFGCPTNPNAKSRGHRNGLRFIEMLQDGRISSKTS